MEEITLHEDESLENYIETDAGIKNPESPIAELQVSDDVQSMEENQTSPIEVNSPDRRNDNESVDGNYNSGESATLEGFKDDNLTDGNVTMEPVDSNAEENHINNDNQQDIMTSLIAKLKVLELQNIEYVNEADNQKRVIEMLRCEVTKKDEEMQVLERDLKNTKESLQSKYNSLNEETSKKMNDLKRAYDQANKDKESMVIKYAMGEKDILIARRGRDDLEKKLREALKDTESYKYKVNTLGTERTRLQGLCETRGAETNMAKKEVERLKEELKLSEAKLTLANDKFKIEAESHNTTKENLDRTFKELLEVQGSIDDIKSEYTDLIAKAKQEEEIKMKKQINQEKEQSVKLMIDSAAAAELESLKKKYKETIDENNELSVKVQHNETELLSYESSLSELKETLAKQKSEIVDLYSQCAELESVKVQLGSEAEKVTVKDAEISRLRAEAADLVADMAACRKKEGELLAFTQKLTDKNVGLQSEFSTTQSRASVLEEEHARMTRDLAAAETSLAETQQRLQTETQKRREETELLARKLAEKVKSLETANQKVIDANNEVEVVRRQNQGRVRELTKELAAVKRRLEAAAGGGEGEGSPGQLSVSSQLSRCSSSSSLGREPAEQPGHTHAENGGQVGGSSYDLSSRLTRLFQDKEATPPPSLSLPPADTQQLLVEKIVKLQKACARRQASLQIESYKFFNFFGCQTF